MSQNQKWLWLNFFGVGDLERRLAWADQPSERTSPYAFATYLPTRLVDHTSRSPGSETSGNLPLNR
ncbi:hypothetical protein GCM10010222_66850 [Streptomyces tanashiensis]|nr:hypothetical protein GCM10010222_66850 [Streptomyces tanashiensis]